MTRDEGLAVDRSEGPSASKPSMRMKDVAVTAGVSIKTVSRVTNDEDHVSPLTRPAVEDAVLLLGDTRNEHAAALRRKPTP
jgi:LacI family transcriptional regulator